MQDIQKLCGLEISSTQFCRWLIVSDEHAGMKSGRKAMLPSVPWQRCQFHLAHAQSYGPKKSMRLEIAEVIRRIFHSPNAEIAQQMKRRSIEKYRTLAPEFSKWLEENIDEGLTVYQFSKEHCKGIRTSNGMERVNREIKRRTQLAVFLPNPSLALR